jgi:hypothetical protein
VGLYPEQFGVQRQSNQTGPFANNDLVHIDPTGANHEKFSYGLKKSLLNFMHGIGLDFPLHDWFDFKVPHTKVPPFYIGQALVETESFADKPTAKIVWLGGAATLNDFNKTSKGQSREMTSLTFQDKRKTIRIKVPRAQGTWLATMLQKLSVANDAVLTLQEVKASYAAAALDDFELFWYGKAVHTLRGFGLLTL